MDVMICTVYARVNDNISADKVYDKAVEYFTSLGFELKENVKPEKAVFERGSILFADVGVLKDKFQTKKCELELNLTKEKNEVTVRCDYSVPWIISSKSRDMAEINNEIKGLERFIVVTYSHIKEPSEHVITEKEIITREIIMTPCKHCGALFEPATTIKCPNCGAGLK